MLPLYRGPELVIQIRGKEYLVSKALLCHFSRYIATASGGTPKVGKPDSSKGGRFKFFKGEKHGSSKEVNYESAGEPKSEKEASEYSSPLVDEPPPYYSTTEPVVLNCLTTRGFEILLQWLYTGRLPIHGTLQQWLSSLIELARCSDLLQIAEIDVLVTEEAKHLFSRTSSPLVVGQNIYEAARLPKSHNLRCLIVKDLVRYFIRDSPFTFSKEIGETPEIEEEFLAQLKVTLATAKCTSQSSSYNACTNSIVDPISGYKDNFNPLGILQDAEKAYFIGAAALQMFR